MDQILSLPDRVKAALEKHPDSMDLKLAAAGWNDARRALAEEKSSSALKNLEAFERRLYLLFSLLKLRLRWMHQSAPSQAFRSLSFLLLLL